jgi:hypothetical protein
MFCFWYACKGLGVMGSLILNNVLWYVRRSFTVLVTETDTDTDTDTVREDYYLREKE